MSDNHHSEETINRWLQGKLSEAERIAFEQSPEGQDYLQIVQATDKLAFPDYDVEAELQKLHALKKEQGPSAFSFWKIAVAVLLIVGVSLVYYLTQTGYTTHNTGFGETLAITLPDASVVTLNANSELRYKTSDFAEDRKLKLRGEAFFEVTRGIDFEVQTSEGSIKVLGTSFNVKQLRNVLEVQVYSGLVAVEGSSTRQQLQKGEGLRLENGVLHKSWTKPVENKPLWISEHLVELEDAPLQEALVQLENSYGITIRSNISTDSIRFTGAFPTDDVESALRIVLSAAELDYTYDPQNKVLTISGRQNP